MDLCQQIVAGDEWPFSGVMLRVPSSSDPPRLCRPKLESGGGMKRLTHTSQQGQMLAVLRSAWIWTASAILILLWTPLLGVVRLFDRDPLRLRTGRWFRRLGRALAGVNPW